MPLLLLPPRDWLAAGCDTRFDAMFEDGQDEVAALVARGLDPTLPVMRAIGVREIAAFQTSKFSKVQSKDAGRLATRHYAKRQYTWFRGQAPADWPRHLESLDVESINRLAIILRDNTLTP